MNGEMIQQLVVVIVMLGAAAWLGRRAWRTVRAATSPKKGSGPGCGCDGCGQSGH